MYKEVKQYNDDILKALKENEEMCERYKNEIKELKKKIPEYTDIKNNQSTKNLPYITIEQKFGKK